MNEFRRDPISGRWVIISASRDARPNHFRSSVSATVDDGRETCPFCVHQMDTPAPVAQYGRSSTSNWEVCVVPNRYPVLQPTTLFSVQPDPSGIDEVASDAGFHEVVIESPRHITTVTEMTREQFLWMLVAYRDRFGAIKEAGLTQGLAIKNSGAAAGASLKHAHSQVFGLPFVPPQIELELLGSQRFYETHGTCPFCAMITAEQQVATRVVAENDAFIAWCPRASRFPFETWIAPKSHRSRFEMEDDESLGVLGDLFRLVVQRVEAHSRIDAFNYLIHSLPFDTNHHDHYHWHIEIIPRVAKAAGFEWGTGIHINTVVPAVAAEQLRTSSVE